LCVRSVASERQIWQNQVAGRQIEIKLAGELSELRRRARPNPLELPPAHRPGRARHIPPPPRANPAEIALARLNRIGATRHDRRSSRRETTRVQPPRSPTAARPVLALGAGHKW